MIRKHLVPHTQAQAAFKKMVVGIFVIRPEGCEVGDAPADVGVVLEGVVALEELGNVANAVALLIGLIYALNLTYPKELRYTVHSNSCRKFFLSWMDTICLLRFKSLRPSFVQLIKRLMYKQVLTLKLHLF